MMGSIRCKTAVSREQRQSWHQVGHSYKTLHSSLPCVFPCLLESYHRNLQARINKNTLTVAVRATSHLQMRHMH